MFVMLEFEMSSSQQANRHLLCSRCNKRIIPQSKAYTIPTDHISCLRSWILRENVEEPAYLDHRCEMKFVHFKKKMVCAKHEI
jgi:hypothetical protein